MIFEINNTTRISNILLQMSPGDTLILNDGIYDEKIEIWIDNITIKAKNKHQAIISNNDYYHKIMSNHNECNTFNTFTIYIASNNVKLEGLTIENRSTPSHIFGQAVALHVDGNNVKCSECLIKSAQDTLFTGPLPNDLLIRYAGFYPKERLKGTPSKQTYEKCTIVGDVDFIFGGATAFFNNCNIVTLKRKSTNPAFISAPSHSYETEFGYLFYRCNIVGEASTYLARPWRDYGTAAFIECNLSNHIEPLGFDKWEGTSRDKTARFYEYNNVDTSQRVPWAIQLTKEKANEYVKNFIKFMEKDH